MRVNDLQCIARCIGPIQEVGPMILKYREIIDKGFSGIVRYLVNVVTDGSAVQIVLVLINTAFEHFMYIMIMSE